jgi:SWIM zinc finger
MTVSSIAHDPKRDAAAALLAETAQAWPVVTLRKPHGAFPVGTRFYAVPSSTPGAAYLANLKVCQCPDYQQRGAICKHVRAVALFEAQQEGAGSLPDPTTDEALGLVPEGDIELECMFAEIAAKGRQPIRSYSDLFPVSDFD